jgi:hypothetical protein
MKKFLKILLWSGLFIILVVVALIGYVQLFWNKTFDAPYPEITASIDPAVIERGRYLAYGPAHCATCHVPFEKIFEVDRGLEMPMIGGWGEEIPGFGTFRAPNLTPDPETGIGNITDTQLARAIRYGVKHDGKLIPPFMLFQEMSDEDLTAVISFLRSQEPVKNIVEPSDLTFVAKALVTFGLLKPQGPKNTPPISVPFDTTELYGKYIARNLGNCLGCHIKLDEKGQQMNADFAGGSIFPASALTGGYAFVSPNLTPHQTTGIMAKWTEEMFIARLKAGRIQQGSPMPWGSYSRMTEGDMKALYRYLHALEPVEFAVNKTVYAPGEELPK